MTLASNSEHLLQHKTCIFILAYLLTKYRYRYRDISWTLYRYRIEIVKTKYPSLTI